MVWLSDGEKQKDGLAVGEKNRFEMGLSPFQKCSQNGLCAADL